MNILLTNDDGYQAIGIQSVKKVLEQYGKVYMVAPSSVKSGMGCGLTSFRGLVAHKIDECTYIVEGTPVDCMQFASVVFADVKFDFVVSGCNNGFNLSLDTMYSGTCGACFQSLIFGNKAIAFSAEKFEKPWQIEQSLKRTLDYVLENKLLSKKYYLCVNFNDPKFEKPKGIKITKLYRRHTYYEVLGYDENTDFYDIHRVHDDITDNDEYDVSAVYNGYISITPIGLVPFRNEHYNEVLRKIK